MWMDNENLALKYLRSFERVFSIRLRRHLKRFYFKIKWRRNFDKKLKKMVRKSVRRKLKFVKLSVKRL